MLQMRPTSQAAQLDQKGERYRDSTYLASELGGGSHGTAGSQHIVNHHDSALV
jgi:hypothetical protein